MRRNIITPTCARDIPGTGMTTAMGTGMEKIAMKATEKITARIETRN